ncbi:MAG: hypothetical protein GAKPKEKM_01833 [Rhodocyclaceae bacterium]|nr:hypothetical protein [Rhodocyclaceae bacterium]
MEDLGIDQKFLVPTQTRSLGEVSGSYTYFADGDVLLAKITPCFENGKLGIADNLTNGIGFGSSEYIVFRPSPEMDKEWLYYFLSQDSFRVEGAERMTGAVGHKRVAKEFIESYPIPVPPLPEQRRIVAILDEAFDGIATAKANAEQNLQNARALFESQLQQIFTEAWEAGDLVTLADLATDITDGDHMPPPKAASGVPFITIGNVAKDSRTIDFSDTFMVPREYFDSLKPNKKPRIGDVLYTVTGSYGIPVLVKEQQDFCFQRHIGLVRPKPDVRSEWLYYLLMSPQIVQQANDGATGTAQKTVSLKVLRGFEVPRLPLATQEEVTAKLNVFATETQHLESLYQQKLAALDELKKSLLHQAFSGQL